MLRKSINLVLAAILMLACFGVGGVTLMLHGRDFGYAVTKSYTSFIREDGQPLASIKARVSALTSTINRTIAGSDELEKQNVRFQLALGKEILSVGSTTMVKLKTGQLYDLLGKTSFQDDIEKMLKLKGNLDALGIPMLYVYPHSYLYEDGLLPDGVSDTNVEMADVLVTSLRAADIPVVDSR